MAVRAPVDVLRTRIRRAWAREPLTDDEAGLERQLGWVRGIGGLSVLLSAWQNPTDVPTWFLGMFVAAGLLLLASGVFTLVLLSRTESPRRTAEALSLVDALAVSMLLPFGVSQDSPYQFFVFTVLALLGGVRLGRLGVLRNLVIAAPFETLSLVVGQSLYGAERVEDTVIAVAVGTGLGVVVADVASGARRARRTATTDRRAAEREHVRARRLAWEVDVVEDIVRTAGTGAAAPALDLAVEQIRERLHVASVQVLSVGPTDALVVSASDGGPPVGAFIDLLPGGPRDRAMSLGTVAAATHDDLETLAQGGPRRGSIVAAPLPVDGRLLGVLVCQSSVGDLLHRRDAVLVGRLGRALAPFVLQAIGADGVDGPAMLDVEPLDRPEPGVRPPRL